MNTFSKTFLIFVAWLAAAAGFAQQNVQILARPATGYVLDQAGMLGVGDISLINGISEGAQRQAQAPIVVVTIPSLASVGAHDVEWYATTLFNAWAIGDRRSNRGVLLLVARDDRKARIEMGAGWGYSRDAECQQVMDHWIIPEFKRGDFAGGIVQGVQALDSLVRNGKVPRKPLPNWVLPVAIVVLVFLVLLVIDIVRNGMEGWAGMLLRGIGEILSSASHSSGGVYRSGLSSSSDSDSGWGGGWSSSDSGFSGGGSSGGGGASGSW